MGMIFKVPAVVIYVLGGLWGLFICMGIIYNTLGFFGSVIAFFVLPFTLYLAPWYAGFAQGNWQPVLVIYGSSVAAFVLFMLGSMFDKD
jgi:hypothetical protein